MHDSAGTQLDDDEDEHGAKEEIVGLEEVTGPDLAGVVAQKSRPVLARRTSPSHLLNVLLNRAFADSDAQLEQFSANPLCPPSQVLLGQTFDQGYNTIC